MHTNDTEVQEISTLLRSDVWLGRLLEAIHDPSPYTAGVFHVFQEESVFLHSWDIECWRKRQTPVSEGNSNGRTLRVRANGDDKLVVWYLKCLIGRHSCRGERCIGCRWILGLERRR